MATASQPIGRVARMAPGGLRGSRSAVVGRGAVGTGAPDTRAGLYPQCPDADELLSACCGHLGDDFGDHPVTRCAHHLAELHAIRRTSPMRVAEIDCRRRELIVTIDQWVGMRPASARGCSFGAMVDTLAAAQVRATLLLHAADSRDERVRAAWLLVGSLADDWDGLITRIGAGPLPGRRFG
ncbi:MAG: DUF4254 domain-containing protein [Nocardia sp.]|nr:DUF4254 domain-containing protein [Nocardia sp.]